MLVSALLNSNSFAWMRQQLPSCLTGQKWRLLYSKNRHKAEESPARATCDYHTQQKCSLPGWLIRRIEMQKVWPWQACSNGGVRVKLCNAIWKLSNCQHSWPNKVHIDESAFCFHLLWIKSDCKKEQKNVCGQFCLSKIHLNMNTTYVNLPGVSKFLWPVGMKTLHKFFQREQSCISVIKMTMWVRVWSGIKRLSAGFSLKQWGFCSNTE